MQHHLFYRLLIISCTFFLISCQQTIECYLIPSTEKASDFIKFNLEIPARYSSLKMKRNISKSFSKAVRERPIKYIETKMPTILSDIVVGKSNRYMDSTMP